MHSYLADVMQKLSCHPLFRAVLSGLLLAISWPATGSITPLIFLAFIPLLLLEDDFSKSRKGGVFRYAFLAFLIWNIGSTYFIFYVEEPFMTKFTASAVTYVLNALFMASIFWLFHKTKKNIGRKQGYIGLVIYWLCFEYIHYHWDINWPWLNLGNVFSNRISWIQWYEFIGVQGGTLWVWLVNLALFAWLKTHEKRFAYLGATILALPITISLCMFFAIEYEGQETEVILVQPNVDPYTEKFELDPIDQLDSMFALAEPLIEEDTKFIFFPETALQEIGWIDMRTGEPVLIGLWESNFENSRSYYRLRDFVEQYPHVELIIGASIRKKYGAKKETLTAREFKEKGFFYDTFNSAIHFTKNGFEFYHKGKLVPGTEKMPFAKYLAFLESLAWDLGGTSGSLGKQKDRELLGESLRIAPLICYESVFGDYVTDYTKLKADAFCIITNDAWWQDAPGYEQHLYYASLRAIENRREIARSANTGVSAFIDKKGRIHQATEFGVKTAISGKIQKEERMTVYATWGDYLTRPFLFVAPLLILWTFFKPRKK
ncbi:MAG: apolipoprotein N-acyltransferase [Bacteroidota bacterium]